jgi:hypothetical protein
LNGLSVLNQSSAIARRDRVEKWGLAGGIASLLEFAFRPKKTGAKPLNDAFLRSYDQELGLGRPGNEDFFAARDDFAHEGRTRDGKEHDAYFAEDDKMVKGAQ